jgi:hypothetical protein
MIRPIAKQLLKFVRGSDLPFVRYGHFVAKSQIFIFVMVKLGKTAWTPILGHPRATVARQSDWATVTLGWPR